MLLERQRSALLSILESPTAQPWKVLVLDERTRDIMSPIIRTNDIHERSITLHMLISERRYPIKSASALYFIGGSRENIDKIVKDVSDGMYASYYVNFCNAISRELLERLVSGCSTRGRGLFVRRVYDGYVDFISLQSNLFTLNARNSFVEPVNVERIVSSLLSVLVSLGRESPFIVADDRTKDIRSALMKKMRGVAMLRNMQPRPLLILVDRLIDVKCPIGHVWTYTSLIDDLFSFQLNKVSFKNDGKDEIIDLDPSDQFWKENGDECFPIVSENVERGLLDYKKEMALKCVDDKSDRKKMEEALASAPDLAKRKASLQAHTSICLALANVVKNRAIDDFFRAENTKCRQEELVELATRGTEEDVLRLGLTILKDDNVDVVESIFKSKGIDTSILRRVKALSPDTNLSSNSYSRIMTSIIGNVKKFLPVNDGTAISKHVENIIGRIRSDDVEGLGLTEISGEQCFDKAISKIIVFCNRGGTYAELKSLNDLSKRIGYPIIYGCTELLNSRGFIEQLKRI